MDATRIRTTTIAAKRWMGGEDGTTDLASIRVERTDVNEVGFFVRMRDADDGADATDDSVDIWLTNAAAVELMVQLGGALAVELT